jgi:hypothetical protein
MSSPTISSISWGRIQFSDSDNFPEGKDYKVYPGGGRPWDWNETDTRHSPGIQIGDVEELVTKGNINPLPSHFVILREMRKVCG